MSHTITTTDMNGYIHTQGLQNSAKILAIQMIVSLWPWFIYFYASKYTLFFLGIALSIMAFYKAPQSYLLSRQNFSIFFALLVAAILGTAGNINAYLGTLLRSFPFFMFMCAKRELQVATLSWFNKIFYRIITFSLFFWILHLIGFSFPHGRLVSPSEDLQYDFDNYYIFLKAQYSEAIFPRFCSIFLEPGYIACFIVLLLFLDKFNFRKWYNIIYLVAFIMTFSVAGWIFFFIALVPYVSQSGKLKRVYLIFVACVVALFIYFSFYTESIIGVMIGERLKFEDGQMVGYNRASVDIGDYWENYFWSSGRVLWGLREDYERKLDVGASVDSRAYIIHYGLLAMAGYVWFMITSLRLKFSRLGLWIFFIVALFVYRGYSVMFIDALLFLYIAALEKLRSESNPTKIEKRNNHK